MTTVVQPNCIMLQATDGFAGEGRPLLPHAGEGGREAAG